MVAFHRANLDTFVAAQRILFDLAQTMAKKQSDLFKELMASSESMLKGYDAKKQPGAYVDEVKAAMEKAMAEVKETVDLGMKAQSEVVDLFVKRASANFDEAKVARRLSALRPARRFATRLAAIFRHPGLTIRGLLLAVKPSTLRWARTSAHIAPLPKPVGWRMRTLTTST